jgi:protein TonB
MKKMLLTILLAIAFYRVNAQYIPLPANVPVTRADSDSMDTSPFPVCNILDEIEAEAKFPGGMRGWYKFLQKNLVYPSAAAAKNVEGMVMLSFQVCEDGSLCNIEAVSGPPELRRSAVNAFRRSPRWIPGKRHGRPVVCYKKQPIVFRIKK